MVDQQQDMPKSYNFTVSGTFEVDPELTPITNHNNTIIGFKDKQGRILKLIVAVQVDEPHSSQIKAGDHQFEEIGLTLEKYNKTYFYETT